MPPVVVSRDVVRRAAVVAALLALGACGGGVHEPADPALSQAMQVGGDAAAQDHPDEAMRQYRRAFTLALAHDTAPGLGDAAYNLAVMQLASGQPADALATLDTASAALRLRGRTPDAAFDLLQGAALHRLGRDNDAIAHLRVAMAQPALLPRASLILARIGDANGRPDLVAEARAALPPPRRKAADAAAADVMEVRALDALARGDVGTAGTLAQGLVDLRRSLRDYAAMTRALALGARAAERTDPQAARALWLRASQAAQAQGDAAQAALLSARARP